MVIYFPAEKSAAKRKAAKKKTDTAFLPRVTITSALPYVNGIKHLGNIVGSLLPADVFHRFLDTMGVDNVYICGTDDHGTAIEIAAAEEGIEPHLYVRKYKELQEGIYKRWNFDFTFFGSTSSPTNHEITKALFEAAYRNKYVIHRHITVPFCENDKRFLPDRYIVGTCPVCSYESARGDQCEQCGNVLDPENLKKPSCSLCRKSDISFRSENHLFLDYGLLSKQLEEWILETDWPQNTKNMALGWIKQGLKPRCITRNIRWGISVPLKGFENLVFYVWFDAPIGYISITKDAQKAGKISSWKEYWTDSKIYHFLGKDNIPFHTIFWPGTLIAAKDAEVDGKKTNFVLPYKVVGYEYLNWEGKKFSTSKGVGLFSDEALDLFPADYWRFYLSYIMPETKDSNFDWDDFQRRINNELIANYGNLFYRVTYFISTRFGGSVPDGRLDSKGKDLYRKLASTKSRVEELVREARLKDALREVLRFSDELNKYFQGRKPWEEGESSADTLYTAINLLRSLSILLYPYIPGTAESALKALNTDRNWDILAEKLKPGHRIEAKMLFRKIDDSEIRKAKSYVSKYVKQGMSGIKTSGKADLRIDNKDNIRVVGNMLPFEEFQKVELVAGTIIDAQDHPNASKLYVLKVDLGKEVRQLVAGLRDKYSKDDLKGKQVVIVANLEPKELRGVKSYGMLLAADDGTLVSPISEVGNGVKIR